MTSVTLIRQFAAPLEAVFEAISTPAGITAWWGPDAGPVLHAEMDLRVGGLYRARFRMLDGTEHECNGRFLEVSPPDRLVMTWRWAGGREAEGESRVQISLRASEGGTELTFTHSLLPDDEKTAAGHKDGWTGSLEKLQRHLSKPDAYPVNTSNG